MTIATTVGRIQYTGNGVTDTFATNFKLFDDEHVLVYLDDTLKTLTTHYTVTGLGASTANIVFLTPPAADVIVTLKLEVPLTQETDLVNGQAFNADTIERGLDLAVQRDQALNEVLDRTVTFPASADITFDPTLSSTITANYLLRVNSAGTGLEWVDPAAFGTTRLATEVTYTPPGTGAVTRSVATKLNKILVEGDYDTYANMKTAAIANNVPFIIQGNHLVFTNVGGAAFRPATSTGSDNSVLTLAASGSTSSNDGAVIHLYGTNHATWPGMLFLTPTTAGAIGKIALESQVNVRRGVVVNARYDLSAGAYDALDVADVDGSLVVYGNTTTPASDPSVAGYSSPLDAEVAIFQQKERDGGISIVTESTYAGQIAFGDGSAAKQGLIRYDHATDSLQFHSNGTEKVRLLSGGNLLLGKTSSNVATDGIELNNGLVQSTNTSDVVMRANRITTNGTIQEWRYAGSNVALIGTNGSGQSVLQVDKISFDGGVTERTTANISGMTIPLATYSPSAASSVDITSVLSSTYDIYEIHLKNIRPGTDGTVLYLRTSVDNGSTFDSGATDYAWNRDTITSTPASTVAGSTGAAQIELALGCAANTARSMSGKITIYNVNNTSQYKHVIWELSHMNNSGVITSVRGGGARVATTAINALRLIYSAGTVSTGTVKIFGYN